METVDNLYKHMTIWGVLLLVFSLVYPFSQVHKFNLESFDVQAQTAVDMRIHENLLAERNRLVEQEKAGFSNDQRLAEIDEDLLMVMAESDARADLADYQLYVISLYTKFGIAGALLGLLSAVVGFRLWYIKVQKPQDVRWHEFHHEEQQK